MKMNIKNALKQCTIHGARCCYYSWRDDVNFEKGFEYKMIRHTNLVTMEKHHKLLLDLGWDKVSDVNAGFTYAWCWYRMPNNA